MVIGQVKSQKVKVKMRAKKNDLSDRLFEFAKRVILLIRLLPDEIEYKVIKYQLIKSAGSSGANCEVAQSGSSTADFIHKIEISLREIKESNIG